MRSRSKQKSVCFDFDAAVCRRNDSSSCQSLPKLKVVQIPAISILKNKIIGYRYGL